MITAAAIHAGSAASTSALSAATRSSGRVRETCRPRSPTTLAPGAPQADKVGSSDARHLFDRQPERFRQSLRRRIDKSVDGAAADGSRPRR